MPAVIDPRDKVYYDSRFIRWQAQFSESNINRVFVADWSFGTLYYIDLLAQGASYTGTKEEFLFGVPLPLTDVIADTKGDMYFATGGRKLASQLYRLRYTGIEASSDRQAPGTYDRSGRSTERIGAIP